MIDWSLLSVINLNIWCHYNVIVSIGKLLLLLVFCRSQQIWQMLTYVQFNVTFIRITLAFVTVFENCINETSFTGLRLLCITKEFSESSWLTILFLQISDSIVSGRALSADMWWCRSSCWSYQKTRCLKRMLLSCWFHYLSVRWVTILLRSFQASFDLFQTLFRFVISLWWWKWLWCFWWYT